MRRSSTVLLIQVIVGLLVGAVYYMVAMVMTVYDGALSLIFQPIMAAICAAVAVCACLALGLPIRLHPRLHAFWRRIWWLPFVIGTVGFALMLLSWHPALRYTVFDPELEAKVQTFHPVLAVTGWFLSIFAAVHFWFPFCSQNAKTDPLTSRQSAQRERPDAMNEDETPRRCYPHFKS